MTTITNPCLGSWYVSCDGASMGVVHGDFVIGFVARDQHDHLLGHYPTYERAIYAVLHK